MSDRTGRPAGGESTVTRTVLPGGLRVITEALPAVRSAAFGIWAGVGSRDESSGHFGATHYLEHLLFKGTRRRTALDISAAMDAVGGELNAFTDMEYTCYYARVLDADLPLAIDVLSDMVTSSLLEPKEVDAERGVILEEIAMNDDDHADTVHQAFASRLFGDTPLGRPVLGSIESINSITREQIARHYAARYTPDNLVVAAAGSLDHAEVVEAHPPGVRPGADRRCRSGTSAAGPRRAAACPAGTGVQLVSREIEQANLRARLRGAVANRRSPVRARRAGIHAEQRCSPAVPGRWRKRGLGLFGLQLLQLALSPTPGCGACRRAACLGRPTTCSPSAKSPRWYRRADRRRARPGQGWLRGIEVARAQPVAR